MEERYMSIWFRHLLTDWAALKQTNLKEVPFVLTAPERNRMVVMAANAEAQKQGVYEGMSAADAQAITHNLKILNYPLNKETELLQELGLWCLRYTPVVAIDPPNGLILNISGCTHLWGDENTYLKIIVFKLRAMGYNVRAAIADTIGTAWAVARYGIQTPIITSGKQVDALMALPPAALRLEAVTLDKLRKLGFQNIKSFITMPRTVLRRRFGEDFLKRLAQALGAANEYITPIIPPVPYVERLPCLEPVRTDKAIEIAVEKLLEALCIRLQAEGKGLRKAILKCFRVDSKMVQTSISTTRGSHNVLHLCKLFALQINRIAPALGIELFVLEATKVENIDPLQEKLWAGKPGLQNTSLSELLDRISNKIGADRIKRFLPAEHYWPERSIRPAVSLKEMPQAVWSVNRPRPIRLLSRPKPIQVMALLPDYPPKVFTFKGKRHIVNKADGPERIEREWWLDKGEHRDYYAVEDEEGQRYWLFRSGHYNGEDGGWYLHGYFA